MLAIFSQTIPLRRWLCAALLVLFAFSVQQSHATAIYSADIVTTLAITDIDLGAGGSPVFTGSTSTGDPALSPPVPPGGFTFTTGSAGATAFGDASVVIVGSGSPSSMGLGDGFSQSAHADGFASPPGHSQSDAAFFTESLLHIDNSGGTSDITVALTMTYDYTLFVSADAPPVEDALAIVDFISFDAATDFTFFSSSDIIDFKALDTLLGDSGELIVSGFTTFDVTVLAGETREILTFTDALGTAAVIVPEPSTLLLLGSGLLGLIGYRRRSAA